MEPDTHDASRRTYLAEERTLLAWWRSGLAAFAVAVGVGRLLPALLDEDGHGPFVALGVAYALLGLGVVLFGSLRERAQAQALAEGGFAPLSRALVTALTAYLTLLALATIVLVVRLSAGSVRRPPPSRTSHPTIGSSPLEPLTEVVPIKDPRTALAGEG